MKEISRDNYNTIRCEDLLRQFVKSENPNGFVNITQNFLFASLSLSWLLSSDGLSAISKPWGGGLKLPDDFQDLVTFNDSPLSDRLLCFETWDILISNDRLSEDELNSVKAVFDRTKKTGTQAPLLSLIMISPLMLLIPSRLSSIRHSRHTFLSVRFLFISPFYN